MHSYICIYLFIYYLILALLWFQMWDAAGRREQLLLAQPTALTIVIVDFSAFRMVFSILQLQFTLSMLFCLGEGVTWQPASVVGCGGHQMKIQFKKNPFKMDMA